MIFIDTDVLWLAFAFHQDTRQTANAAFLEQVQTAQPATTIYNVLELLGKLSFNLSPEQLDEWRSWLVNAYQLLVVWPTNPELTTAAPTFREELFERPYQKMRAAKMPFMDALILNLAERTPTATHFVTWNARHFQGKTPLQVLTPEGYVQAQT
ncbi:MAG: hypothetical protein KC425_20285 [Anaerolineales bacterium]|nr:hypothetical protein [Anaerolineales bacterium]